MNYVEAINQSATNNEIVTLSFGSESEYNEACSYLAQHCDDVTNADDVSQYWGTDDDGDAWRVHVRLEAGTLQHYAVIAGGAVRALCGRYVAGSKAEGELLRSTGYHQSIYGSDARVVVLDGPGDEGDRVEIDDDGVAEVVS